jgi:ATP-binding cassette subfamily F protein uup
MARNLLLSLENLTKGFGSRPLFSGVSFGLFEGDHVGLIGPNGSGKTTLLKIAAGLDEPDSGNRALRKSIRIGYVPQDPSFVAYGIKGHSGETRTIEEVIATARELSGHAHDPFDESGRVGAVLRRSGFPDPHQVVSTLSGGWRKRLAIAAALIAEPQLLLMDEPTNHLDVEGILWLETVLKEDAEAFLVVSHDRYFLENIARRMIELDRVYPKGILEAEGSYSEFLEKRDALLANQQAYQESLANVVRREIEWLRRGAKARTRKSQARIGNAEKMIAELADGKERMRTAAAGIDFTATDRKTKRLVIARGIGKTLGGRTIIDKLDLLLTPGLRLGLLGPNGSGKTTLLNLLDETLTPDRGTIERADRLRIVRFNQNRETLDLSVSLRRALAPEGDTVVFRDRPMHVSGWAKRFLFRGEQLDTPLSALSGGEQARILIARLMLQPADVLLLDEPTNDLDIPTLEVLEESLLDFPGALVLVTHDRYLIDRVSTRILALDGQGRTEFFADYSQWETRQKTRSRTDTAAPPTAQPARTAAPKKKLGYLQQREMDGMEDKIRKAEERLEAARRALHDPNIASDFVALEKRGAEVETLTAEVVKLYARWAELEAQQG